MTFVCLLRPAGPTGAAGAADTAARLLRVAPRVRVEPCLIWADGRGLDARPLTAALLGVLREAGVESPRAGIAATPVAAGVAAVHVAGEVTIVPPGGDRDFLAPHPLAVLEPPCELVPLLDAAGIERCGELARLDQASVEARLGTAGIALWRLARADDRRLLFGPAPRPLPHASLEWTDYVLRDPERLLFVINRLVGAVCAELRAEGRGARGFTLTFSLARGDTVEQPFHPSRASADQRAWVRLVRHALERLRLPDGVVGIALGVDAVEPSERVQGDLLDRGFASAGAAEEALVRILERDAAVVTPRNSHHPLLRRRTHWVEEPSSLVWARPQLGPCDTDPELMLYLLPEPQPIDVETVDRAGFAAPIRYRELNSGWHELVAASGPDCLSGGQWDMTYAYEMYCCVRADGELVQLCRDAVRGSWEVAGVWR